MGVRESRERRSAFLHISSRGFTFSDLRRLGNSFTFAKPRQLGLFSAAQACQIIAPPSEQSMPSVSVASGFPAAFEQGLLWFLHVAAALPLAVASAVRHAGSQK